MSWAEEEDEDSACWFEGAKERNPDMLCAVIETFPTDTCSIAYPYGGEWEFKAAGGAELFH